MVLRGCAGSERGLRSLFRRSRPPFGPPKPLLVTSPGRFDTDFARHSCFQDASRFQDDVSSFQNDSCLFPRSTKPCPRRFRLFPRRVLARFLDELSRFQDDFDGLVPLEHPSCYERHLQSPPKASPTRRCHSPRQ